MMKARVNEALGFAVSPVIENQAVIVEVDRGRLRPLRRWLGLALLVLVAAIFDGWQKSKPVEYGYKLAQVQQFRATAEADTRFLQVELLTLTSPQRIELLAKRLNLVQPAYADTFIVQRVVSDQPPSSVVASR